jgi:hypothetical protein
MSDRCPHNILRSEVKCPHCDRKPPTKKFPRNLAGIRFGKVICVQLANKGVMAEAWRCLCDCGETVVIGRCSLLKSSRLGHVSACPNCRAYAAPRPDIDRPYLDHSPAAEAPSPPRARVNHIGKSRDIGPDVVIFDTGSVLDAVAEAFKLSVAEVRGEDRSYHFTEARAAAYWLLLKHTRMSAVSIARTLGKRDHSTVLHGFKRCEKRRAEDTWYRRQTDELERELEAKAKGEVAA